MQSLETKKQTKKAKPLLFSLKHDTIDNACSLNMMKALCCAFISLVLRKCLSDERPKKGYVDILDLKHKQVRKNDDNSLMSSVIFIHKFSQSNKGRTDASYLHQERISMKSVYHVDKPKSFALQWNRK